MFYCCVILVMFAHHQAADGLWTNQQQSHNHGCAWARGKRHVLIQGIKYSVSSLSWRVFIPEQRSSFCPLLSAYTGEIKLSVSHSLNVEETFRF